MTSEKKQTLMAVARLACMIAVPLLALFGIETDADTAFNVVMLVASVGVIVWGWWKNAPITEAAKDAQVYLDTLKEIKKDDEMPVTGGDVIFVDEDPAQDGGDI